MYTILLLGVHRGHRRVIILRALYSICAFLSESCIQSPKIVDGPARYPLLVVNRHLNCAPSSNFTIRIVLAPNRHDPIAKTVDQHGLELNTISSFPPYLNGEVKKFHQNAA